MENEKREITKALTDYYLEGHVKADPKLYEQILHPEWRMFLMQEGKLVIVERSEYISFYDPAKADPEEKWEMEILSMDVAGQFASVKLRLESQKVRYIDYFNMMKLDGKWWIMHKMSQNEKETPD